MEVILDVFVLVRKLVSSEVGINEVFGLSVFWDLDYLFFEIRVLGDLVEYWRIMKCGSCYCGYYKYFLIKFVLLWSRGIKK